MDEIRCPNCEQNFSVDLARCPHCGTASLWKSSRPRPQVVQSTEMLLAGDKLGGERLATKLAAVARPKPVGDWSYVRQGLQIASWGLILGIILAVANLFAVFIPAAEGALAATLQRVLRLVSLVAVGVVLLGTFLCCSPPRESGLRVLARVAMGCLVAALVLALFAVVLLVSRTRDEAVGVLFLFSLGGLAVVGFAGSLLFILTLRGVARAFYEDKLGMHFILYFVASLIVYAGYVAFSMALLASLRPDEDPRGSLVIVGCSGSLFSLLLQAWLLGLFGRLHERMGLAR